MKITHLFIYQVARDGVFDKVNSYSDMNNAIKKYGDEYDTNTEEYKNRVGLSFEIFTQFFALKWGNHPLIGIKNIQDTSDNAFNKGFDFTFIDFFDKNGQIQSKWKNNPLHQFTFMELMSNSAIASDMDIEKNNNILFINFDDREELFHYDYPTARNKRRIFDRNTQETIIKLDPTFWDDFRQCIKDSSKNSFTDPYKPRDIQDWILNGHNDYEGTISVLNGKYSKGRVEASTGAGKTLCQFYNIKDSFDKYNKNVAVMILPTLSLINQTFMDFYQNKMFGYSDKTGNVDTGISCLIIMSGSRPRYNDQIVTVLQTLNVKEATTFIEKERSIGRKVVVFTTMKSHDLKYSDMVDSLKNNGIRIGLEIVDEYHNIISSSSERGKQLDIAEYLENNESRTDGTIFYSASNKDGQILSSFNEDLFGKLLCKVTRNDLRERAYVSPKLLFKCIKMKPNAIDAETKRDASRVNLDINKAQSEAVGVIVAYNDAKEYYKEPNMITFGDHVEGCRYISSSELMKLNLPDVKNYFVAAETSNSDRSQIFENVRNSGGNIIHQHSVAKEGVNIQNLHAGLLGRDLSIISMQQAIGRSDRALYEDTLNFQKGLITLDNPIGWKKYYNLIYVIIDDEDETFKDRVKEIVRYLLNSGIPESEWDVSFVDDDGKNGIKYDKPEFSPTISNKIVLDHAGFKQMIEKTKAEIVEEQEKIQSMLKDEQTRSLSVLELLKKNYGH